jgi:AraC family transcriptional regulator of adaptative response/methylated-DNA-[protein]-cysteine methyltransferase
MLTSHQDHSESQASDVLIPLIRAAATIGFAIAPCSLGFVIIAVSEQLIRSIMVGDDPEMLVSALQNQFPNEAIEVADKVEELVVQVLDLIDRPGQPPGLPLDIRGAEFQVRFVGTPQHAAAGTTLSYAS